MRIIFTRHGETKENAAGISMGQGIGGTLNKEGLRQTGMLAERLKGEKIDYVYVSDLQRATETAFAVQAFHPQVKVISTPSLRERNLGIFEGGRRDAWQQAMKKSPVPFHAFKPQGGESYEELLERMSHFFQSLLQKHRDDSLLLISHGGALTMLYLHLFQRPITLEEYERFKPGNTAITICDISSDGKIQTRLMNSTEHLDGTS